MRSPSLSLAPDRSTGAISVRLAGPAEARGPLRKNVLACVRYGAEAGDDPREIGLALEAVEGAGGAELWLSDRPADVDRDGGFAFAHNGEYLFGHLYVLEVELEAVAAATFKAYARLTAFLDRRGYPNLLRCWNFLSDINRGGHDQERYKQFCLGRYQALAGNAGFEHQLPAATAIGMRTPGLLISFLAGKRAGVQVENPRQTPAFHYPRQYGPRSPSFSRATFYRFGDAPHLLVSGTASVVGHATVHPGDSAAQLEETLANVEALLAHARASHLPEGGAWAPQALRLYLRHRADLPLVRARLRQALGANAPVVVLEGDICRTDLNLELEGVYRAVPG